METIYSIEEQIMVEDKYLDEQWMSKHLDTMLMDKKLQEMWMDKWLSNVVWDELIHNEETEMVKTMVETEDCCVSVDMCCSEMVSSDG
ncbi:hypothetical protein Tco_1449545 [Tanacetum coccineum]